MSDPKLLPTVRSTDRDEEIELSRLWYAVLRQRWLVLGVTALAIVAGGLLAAFQPPTYRSEATLHIQQDKSGFDLLGGLVPAQLGLAAGLGGGGGNIQTDIAVLRSRQVAEDVVDSLALHVALVEPRRARDEVLHVLSAPRTERKSSYTLQREQDGSYRIRTETGTPPAEPAARAVPGQPFRLGEVTLALRPSLTLHLPEQIRVEIMPFRATVAEMQKQLRVNRASSGAQVIDVQYRHRDPALAAEVPNAVTASFIQYKNRVGRAESRSSVDFLQEQSATYAGQLRDAEARLQQFREQAQIVEPRTQATEQVRRLAELQASRDGMDAERETLQRVLTGIEHSAQGNAGPSPYRQLAAFPTFIANGTVQNILQSLILLENRRAELLVQRTPQHVDVQGVEGRVRELEVQLYQLARNYLDGVDSGIVSLDAQLGRFAGQVELVPAREVAFLRLTREQKLLEEVHTMIQTRLKEAEIREASEMANVQVIDTALVPETPASPKPLLYLVFSSVLGLAMGLGTAVIRAYVDPKVRNREDVITATSGLPVLGTIPRAPARSLNGNGRRSSWTRRIPARTSVGEVLVTREDPWTPGAEAYRTLRTNLALDDSRSESRVLVVTSAAAEDGKSTCASNLAVALAQQGSRTLLVDADLRRGALHVLFEVSRGPGLTETLGGQVPLDDAVHEIAVGATGLPLHLLSTGALPPNPAEVLGSVAMRKLLEQLHGLYDTVIVDAPPLNPVADAGVLGKIADHVILVARAGATNKQALHEAVDQLRLLRVPVAGVVVNDVDSHSAEYYGTEAAYPRSG